MYIRRIQNYMEKTANSLIDWARKQDLLKWTKSFDLFRLIVCAIDSTYHTVKPNKHALLTSPNNFINLCCVILCLCQCLRVYVRKIINENLCVTKKLAIIPRSINLIFFFHLVLWYEIWWRGKIVKFDIRIERK